MTAAILTLFDAVYSVMRALRIVFVDLPGITRHGIAYFKRDPAHVAEVARLARTHDGVTHRIDRFAQSRAMAYDATQTELTLIDKDPVPGFSSPSLAFAKMKQETKDDRY